MNMFFSAGEAASSKHRSDPTRASDPPDIEVFYLTEEGMRRLWVKFGFAPDADDTDWERLDDAEMPREAGWYWRFIDEQMAPQGPHASRAKALQDARGSVVKV